MQNERHGSRPKDDLAAMFNPSKDKYLARSNIASEQAVTDAINKLRHAEPEMSAGRRMWFWQYFAYMLVLGTCLGTALSAPQFAGLAVLIASALLFAAIAAFRLLLMATLVMPARTAETSPTKQLRDDELPTYSVLVPLFREAEVLHDLVDALATIDYPPDKLDIILILEACDLATLNAASEIALPSFMRVLVVPDRQPRTKPKALNVALPLALGERIAVYDAEDIPEPDQLRKAAAALATGNPKPVCVQARLAIYNPRQSWLTRGFMAQTPQEFL